MKSLLLTLLMLIIGEIRTKNNQEIILQCPHDPRLETGFAHGSVDLDPIPYKKGIFTKHIENNCPFDVSIVHRLVRDVRYFSWKAKSSNTDTTAASNTSFDMSESDDRLSGICGFHEDITRPKHGQRRAILCLDVSCNQTDCLPTLHIIIPQQFCQSLKQCSIHAHEQKIIVRAVMTFCPEGIVISGICIVPLLNQLQLTHQHSTYSVHVTCFFEYSMAKDSNDNKFVEEMNKLVTLDACKNSEYSGGYVCFISGYGTPIYVPYDGNYLALEIVESMKYNHYGEDHDRLGEGESTAVMAGNGIFVVSKDQGNKNFTGECFTGGVGYTSLYFYPVKTKGKHVTFLTLGVIPEINFTMCIPKVLPLVWTGTVDIRGEEETLDECKIHCILSGSGANCEAYSSTGIFDLMSDDCLIGKTHKYRRTEDQVTFTCRNIMKDIRVKCNGENITVPMKSLVVGQCIYTITSFFSFFPTVAHSLATEMCIEGLHGWLTIIIFFTFCFGWILIPALTMILLTIIKYIVIIFSYFKGGARFNTFIDKMKEEFIKTIGRSTCDVCLRECSTKDEYNAHENYCKKGNCPYCNKDVGVSQTLFEMHFSHCKLIDRFNKNLQSIFSEIPPYSRRVRRLESFRYRNRCYIMTIWLLLLIIEMVIWGSSAQDMALSEWQDTAHGIGYVKMQQDYELDFALVAGSSFVHKRVLTTDEENKPDIPFTIHLKEQKIETTIQNLGNWMDGEVNIKSVFHCWGGCKKYSYPWQLAACHEETDYAFQSNWACNPVSCPGINSGCTACGLYIDKLNAIGRAYRLSTIKYTREACYQLGSKSECKTIEANDCLVSNGVKICLTGTTSNIETGITIVFLGPLVGGGILVRDWCTSNCKFGDPGDVIMTSEGMKCPDYEGTLERICRFGKEPVCRYSGNTVSGIKKFLSTRDAYTSVNLTDPKMTESSLTWYSPGSSVKDHINVVVNRDINFEDLSETPCKVNIKTIKIAGAWGSGIGFTLTCEISLSDCTKFLTTIKSCDSAICYGGNVAHLNRGMNTVEVSGKGGHSGSEFKCCHDDNCSPKGLKAEPPHLKRAEAIKDKVSMSFSDGAPEVGIVSWFKKVAEWFKGLFSGNWLVLILMLVLLIGSLFLLILLCPVKKYRN
ncbi:glycoprotein precursor, partial [Brno virus]